jgi:hypothetical protein
MKTVVGLFWGDDNVQNSVRELKEAGLAENSIGVLTRYDAVRELLGADQGHVVAKYALWGALLGIATFAPFGLAASICECTLLHYNPGIGVGILIAFAAIGMGFGAFMGHFVGVDKAETSYHLFCQGVCRGGKLVVVQASDEQVANAVSTLRQGEAVGVRLFRKRMDGKEFLAIKFVPPSRTERRLIK